MSAISEGTTAATPNHRMVELQTRGSAVNRLGSRKRPLRTLWRAFPSIKKPSDCGWALPEFSQ